MRSAFCSPPENKSAALKRFPSNEKWMTESQATTNLQVSAFDSDGCAANSSLAKGI